MHSLCSSVGFVCNISIWHVIIKPWWAKFTVFSWLLKWRNLKASLERERSLICWSSKFKSWSLRSGISCQCLFYKKGYWSRRGEVLLDVSDWPKYSGYHVIGITATSVLYSIWSIAQFLVLVSHSIHFKTEMRQCRAIAT